MSFKRGDVVFNRIIDAYVEDLKARAFQHHRNKILADVVNVAFHGADDHRAHWLCTGFCKQRTENRHAPFHRICSQQDFGNEKNAIAEVDAHDRHTINERLTQDLFR